MKANALGLIESLGNLFAEWKTVREALNCLCVWFCGVYLSSHWALARMCFGFCHSPVTPLVYWNQVQELSGIFLVSNLLGLMMDGIVCRN